MFPVGESQVRSQPCALTLAVAKVMMCVCVIVGDGNGRSVNCEVGGCALFLRVRGGNEFIVQVVVIVHCYSAHSLSVCVWREG